MNPIKLSRGNSKIHKALIWNITSRKTCPGATTLCKKICYAADAEVFRKNTVPQSRDRNLLMSKQPDFADLMIEKIKRSRLKKMRLHESGDFYNQKYLNAWVKIIGACPDVAFWAYTKSYTLDFSKALKLKNLVLRYSTDATSKHEPKQKIPFAAVSAVRTDAFICPSTLAKGHAVQCMLDCSYCLEEKGPLIFRPHGKGAKLAGKIECQTTLDLGSN